MPRFSESQLDDRQLDELLGAYALDACDVDEAKARSTADKFGVKHWYTDAEAMLGAHKLELVDIVTRVETHRDVVGLVVRRRVPAIVQKPFGQDIAEVRRMVDLGLLTARDLRFAGRKGTVADRMTPREEVISGGMPTMRKMQVKPFWIFTSPGDATPEEEQAAIEIEKSIIFHAFTLGPSAHTPGTFAHWDQVRDDLTHAIQLGWIPDATLANNLVSQLGSAREAFNATDGTLAKSQLDILIQTITQSTSAQRRREVADLILLNAQRLKEATPDTIVPIEPKLKLSPQSSMLPLGTLDTLIALKPGHHPDSL